MTRAASHSLLLAWVLATAAGQAQAESTAHDQQADTKLRFAQSVIYHSLSGFCSQAQTEASYQSAFHNWRLNHREQIQQGRLKLQQQAMQQDKTMNELVNAMIHAAEQDWSQLDAAGRVDKCQHLLSYLQKQKAA